MKGTHFGNTIRLSKTRDIYFFAAQKQLMINMPKATDCANAGMGEKS